MSRVRGSLEIARPVEAVFDTVVGHTQCDPTPAGTRFTWDWNVTVTGPARLAGPLVALIGRRQERTIWTALKRHLEGANDGSA